MTASGAPKRSSYDGFTAALASLMGERRDVAVLECRKVYPDADTDLSALSRRIRMPVSEQDTVLTAAGVALGGFTVYIDTPHSPLLIARAYEQIRSAVAVANLKVMISSVHDGDSFYRDGAVRQMFEDFALMRAIPNMIVLAPSDYRSAYALVRALAKREGPAYIRLSRHECEDMYGEDDEFHPGGAMLVREGNGVTICANGMMVQEALTASEILRQQGIEAEIIDCYSIEPLPEQMLLASVRRTGCCVVAEKHIETGGLFGAVAECLGREYTVPVRGVAMSGGFGQSGLAGELNEYYGLTYKEIVHNVVQVWAMRRR